MSSILSFKNARVSYGDTVALHDVSFSLSPGEMVALVGHNGAGKTTLIKLANGLVKADSGTAEVFGSPARDLSTNDRSRIGVQFQEPLLPRRSTVGELCDLYRSIFDKSDDSRVGELLKAVGLDDMTDRIATNMSGGEQQRLCLVLALIGDPELVFLDELSSGLDPQVRRQVWMMVADDIRTRKATCLLTSHSIDEVEILCDRVVVLRSGVVVLDASVRELLESSRTKLSAYLVERSDGTRLEIDALDLPSSVTARYEGTFTRLIGPTDELGRWLENDAPELHSSKRELTLDDVLAPYYSEGESI